MKLEDEIKILELQVKLASAAGMRAYYEAKGVAEFLEGHDKARAICVAQAALNSAREKFR